MKLPFLPLRRDRHRTGLPADLPVEKTVGKTTKSRVVVKNQQRGAWRRAQKKMAAPYIHEAATLSLNDTESDSNSPSGSFFASYFASIFVAFMT
jgi:hypothetical protein